MHNNEGKANFIYKKMGVYSIKMKKKNVMKFVI